MKTPLFCLFFLLCSFCGFSRHIKGGFFNYQYLGKGVVDNTKLNYKISLTVYMDCTATGNQVDPNINFTIFSGTSSTVVANALVTKSADYLLQKTYDDPCITGNQAICFYRIVVYELSSYELPVSPDGYTISYQRCCRIQDMDNISNSGAVGNTYTIKIPGTSSVVPNAVNNSSPSFPVNDTVIICENSFFRYPFTATDSDGDSLRYTFCTAYNGGSQTTPSPTTASSPGYATVPYASPYNGAMPLGAQVTINSATGLISGIAPPILNTGEYAVTVCVTEYRNGVYLGETRKELHIRVKDCTVTTAFLNPVPTSCDGFGLNFSNEATNPSGTDYLWTFGDTLSGSLNSSTTEKPFHAYTDTGVYLLKLRVSIGGLCADSTTSLIKVYPGFFPGFRANAPLCKGAPVQFVDTTKTAYGNPTGWKWNFGDLTSTTDSSNAQNPAYTFKDSGTYKVQFIVANTFGCIDTITNNITIHNSPVIRLNTQDTLICVLDSLQITTANTGTFSWSPNYNISSLNTANPMVYPALPTTYFLTFTDLFGCVNKAAVFVAVTSKITIDAGRDTTICRTDGLRINTTSNALHYIWTPATYLNSDTAKRPLANPLAAVITYQVTGNIGKCRDSATITITTLPYPPANAGLDTTVCFGTAANLMATGGISYQWSPATFLSDINIAAPTVINPTTTTHYVVRVFGGQDAGTCPKPAFDSVTVFVDPLVTANAGPADTTAVLGEPLLLTGSGGGTYLWEPAKWLNNPLIANPIANPEDNITYHLLVTSIAGCQHRDSIQIKLYKVPPSFYVPTAFSPNNDNNNDILKPILLGMKTLDYFRVYNRAGQLLYTTSQKGAGWDGYYKGNPQDPATYIWMAQGTMFTGEKIVRKGYAVLLR